MNVNINAVNTTFNDQGDLVLREMVCYIQSGQYPDSIQDYVSIGAEQGITLASNKAEIEKQAIAKFKANVEALTTDKPSA